MSKKLLYFTELGMFWRDFFYTFEIKNWKFNSISKHCQSQKYSFPFPWAISYTLAFVFNLKYYGTKERCTASTKDTNDGSDNYLCSVC